MKKHIAIVAPIGAGKTTISKYFQNKGFQLYRLSQGIYEEAEKRGLDREDRVVLQDIGDELRKKFGVSVLAQKAIMKYKETPDKSFVFESIRNHNELLELKHALGDDLLILAIDAPLEVRYKRVVDRKGQYKEQNTTFEEFKKINDRDLGKDNKSNEQNVQKCLDMADVTIDNSGTEEELYSKIEDIYDRYFS